MNKNQNINTTIKNLGEHWQRKAQKLKTQLATANQSLEWMREYEKSLNVRANVEQELFNVANGSAPLPDAEQCREWAMKLGVPNEWRQRKL